MLAASDPMLEDAWISEHEDHLLRLWEYLQRETRATGIHVLDQHRIDFPRFCQLCYRNSTIPDKSLYGSDGALSGWSGEEGG